MTRYLANSVVSCRDEGEDGALLFNPDLDGAALINPTGRLIWDILVLPHTVEEISNLLAEKLNITDASVVENDVDSFLKTLQPDYILVDED
ncbi:MAG: PqqD family peptide modification chaperone [Methanothrix sp.]